MFSFISNYWRKLLLPTATIAIITVFVFIPRKQATDEAIVISEPIPTSGTELLQGDSEVEKEQVEEEEVPTSIVVDVKGAVTHPGVYTLDEGDRLGEAIEAAGGYIAEADSRMLNHAQKLTDELLIYVPFVGEESAASEMGVLTGQESVATTSGTSDSKVNLNTADEGELTTLPGIGPAKAEAIIQYRTDQGLFQSPEALMEVSGIGQKTFENLEEYITTN